MKRLMSLNVLMITIPSYAANKSITYINAENKEQIVLECLSEECVELSITERVIGEEIDHGIIAKDDLEYKLDVKMHNKYVSLIQNYKDDQRWLLARSVDESDADLALPVAVTLMFFAGIGDVMKRIPTEIFLEMSDSPISKQASQISNQDEGVLELRADVYRLLCSELL